MRGWVPVAGVVLVSAVLAAEAPPAAVPEAYARAARLSPPEEPLPEPSYDPFSLPPVAPFAAPSPEPVATPQATAPATATATAGAASPATPDGRARAGERWDPQAAVREALTAVAGHPGRLTLAVQDLTTGAFAVHGGSSGTYDTASIVKADIVAALLLQAQRRGYGLTAEEQRLAAAAIRTSDNDATDVLWRLIGGAPGLDAANDVLGLTATTAGPYGAWGLTQTTATDQILLLEAVFRADSPLTASSRRHLEGLMSSVVPGQDWGVPTVAPGAPRVVKNGWLPRSTTGLWDVNSIGRVEYAGRAFLVCVLTDGQPSREAGTALVERAATAAVHALAAGPG